MSYETTDTGLLVPRSISAYASLAKSSQVASWRPWGGDSDDPIVFSHSQLRDQSRDLERNDSIATGAICNVVSAVVAEGLSPHSSIDPEALGISPEEAKSFEKKSDYLFKMISAEEDTDFTRSLNFSGLLELAFRSVLIDGDSFLVKRYVERPTSLVGTCLQLIDGARVKSPPELEFKDNCRAGIEYSKSGEPVAFHVSSTDANGVERFTRIPYFDKNGRRQAKHLIHRKYASQTRGVPYLTPVIEKLKQLNKYTEAEITAAVVSGMLTIFVKNKGINPMRGRAKDDTGERSHVDLKSGAMVDLFPGEEVESVNPGRPNSEFDNFVTAILKQIAIGLELPFEVLTKYYQSSYTAARAAICDAWSFYRVKRRWIIQMICEPYREWLTDELVSRNLLSAPGYFDDLFVKKAWLACEWSGAPMTVIDPLKEAKAATERIMVNHTDSRTDECKRNGRDFDRIAKNLAAEDELIPETKETSKDDKDTEGDSGDELGDNE